MLYKLACLALGVALSSNAFSKDIDCIKSLPDHVVLSEPDGVSMSMWMRIIGKGQ
jgi:hypothetical protein